MISSNSPTHLALCLSLQCLRVLATARRPVTGTRSASESLGLTAALAQLAGWLRGPVLISKVAPCTVTVTVPQATGAAEPLKNPGFVINVLTSKSSVFPSLCTPATPPFPE